MLGYPPGSRHPPEQTPPWEQTPPEQTPPESRPSGTNYTPMGLSTPPGTRYTPPREANSGIRSKSGQYASYWNAFLFVMFPSLVSFPGFLIHTSQVKFSLALWPNPKSYWTSDPHHWPKVDEATPSKTTTDKSASSCTFEFSRITRWQKLAFLYKL